MYIVLAITIFMAVMFIINKVKFGVVSMTCCVLLVLTGVMDVQTAFSGFANKTVILIAPMLVLSAAITKTSIVAKISEFLNAAKGKKGILLIILFYVVGAAFVQFIPATATISIMLAFMGTLDDTGDVTPGRILLPLLGVMMIWKGFLPIGMGATSFATLNARYEGIIQNEAYLTQMLDPFKVTLVPCILLTLYSLFAWRLMPKESSINKSAVKEVKETEKLPKAQENLIYIVFVAVMAVLVLNKWTGNYMYIAPAVGVLVLLYGKAITVPEAIKGLTQDMIWMIAGVLVVADALGKSGAGDLIGQSMMSVLGEHPSSLMVIFLFTAVTIVMTSFISNNGCVSVLVPIAASIAVAGNMDPRGLVLAVSIGSRLAIAFPSGAGESAVCYAAGGYNPAKTLPYTLPYMIIAIVSLALSCNFFFPVYG